MSGLQDSDMQGSERKQADPGSEVVGWIMPRVERWERAREQAYDSNWNEYYRLWRGIWSPEDRTRNAERSRIISPALTQAIEGAVAEMEESIFHRKNWVDIEQDVSDTAIGQVVQTLPPEQQQSNEQMAKAVMDDMSSMKAKLLEDLDLYNVEDSLREIILNAALYGTGIGKLVVERKKDFVSTPDGVEVEAERNIVSLVGIDPREFVIDTAAISLDEALGMAHIYHTPTHEVLRKQIQGVYRDDIVIGQSPYSNEALSDKQSQDQLPQDSQQDNTEIIEYHGFVPRDLFNKASNPKQDNPLESVAIDEESEEDWRARFEYVEVIAWIGNRGHLLKIVENPFTCKDRSFVAVQWETVPNRFWGRGVAEKGYNPQKALDAEMRARVDALGLSTYPMMIVNGGLMPRGGDFSVRPGRNIITQGPPNESLAPFKFPPPDPQSYKQSSELERMVTMATGTMDTAAPLGVNPRNETAGGMSMMLGSMLKRSKRTLRNLERQLVIPVIRKTAWRYMQFDPVRYPKRDYKFRIYGALGAQAREFEVAQLGQLLQTQEQGSVAYWILFRTIINNYNIDNKDDFLKIVDQMTEQAMNPQPPEPTVEEKVILMDAQRRQKELDHKIQTDVENQLNQDREAEAEAIRDRGEAIWNMSEAVLNQEKAEVERARAVADIIAKLSALRGPEESVSMREVIKIAEQVMLDHQVTGTPTMQGLEAVTQAQMNNELEAGEYNEPRPEQFAAINPEVREPIEDDGFAGMGGVPTNPPVGI